MCKIAILTQHNADKLSELILSTWRLMSATERDGYGAAWVGPDGKLRTARSSQTAFATGLPDFCEAFGEHDELTSNGGPLLIHGRTATCGVSLENTHPMVSKSGDCALVHNGVVSSKRFHNVRTTCDSELLLLAHKQGGIDAVAKDVSGYFAYGFLQLQAKGRAVLDVVCDDRATLHAGTVGDGWAFATTPQLFPAFGGVHKARFRSMTVARFVDGKHVKTRGFVRKSEPTSASVDALSSRAFAGALAEAADACELRSPRYVSTNLRGPGLLALED